jgi:hypothetical protein
MAKEPEVHHYDVPVDRLHQAVVAAIGEQKRWKVQEDEGPGGALRFNTGLSIWSWSGQDMEAVTAAEASGSTLTIGGKVAQRGLGSVQQVSWGEAGRIAKKLKDGVDAALGSAHDVRDDEGA